MKFIVLVLASLLCVTQVGAQTEKQKVPAPSKAKKEVKPETKPVANPQPDARTPEQRIAAYREYLQAQQYEAESNFIQAVESYKKVIELDPQSPEPRVALGELYF